MTLSRRGFLKSSSLAVVGAATAMYLQPPQAFANGEQIDPDIHLLNRITWGARPEDVQRIKGMGYVPYLEEQLNPEILDDSDTPELSQLSPILEMNRSDLFSVGEFRPYVPMIMGMVLRATHSRAQLYERMVDFWGDHFNVSADELYNDMVFYHREVLRKHAMGNFRDILLASAKSPAMLTYLDNEVNIAEHPNENYARELLELHTLGVDGGYSEDDVKAVARVLTGWTISAVNDDGFYFNEAEHDYESKTILGRNFPAGRGIEEGLHLITILAEHPSTAQFLSRKLCVRFISDNPPQSIVDSTATVWMQNRGDVKPVLRHILTSQEFLNSTGQKFRRPLEFFVGALRATGTRFVEDFEMIEVLQSLAHVPYGWTPPNGYPDVAGAWVNTNGLLNRWNVADMLTNQAHSYEETNLMSTLHERIGQPATVNEMVDSVSINVFGYRLEDSQRQPYIEFTSNGMGGEQPVTPQIYASKLASLYCLMLSSPQYQWR